MTKLHSSLYERIIDDRICFGFADCFKTELFVLQEIVDDDVVIDSELFETAKMQALNLITNDYAHVWEILRPVYAILFDIETNWCRSAPSVMIQPNDSIYTPIGTTMSLVCEANDFNGNYTWLKDGFPSRNEHNQELVLPSVDINDEGQYQCSVWELHYQLYPTCMSIVH